MPRLLALLFVLLVPVSAWAQESPLLEPDEESDPESASAPTTPAPRADAAASPVPVSLAISGAASGGSYEGGFVYYLIESLRRSPDLQLAALVGTSAGSINALIGALSHCGEAEEDPFDSIFWRTWIPIGTDVLFDPDQVTPVSLFTRAPFAAIAQEVEQRLAAGVPRGCDVRFGASVTRIEPAVASEDARFAWPRMSERFLVQLRGRGVGTPVAVTNERPREGGSALALFPIDDGGSPFASLRDVVFASSGFPGAFAPQVLHYCPADTERCTDENSTHAEFVDGGLFNAHPVALARWAVHGLPGAARAEYVLINPNLRRYPERLAQEVDEAGPRLVDFVLGLVGRCTMCAISWTLQEAIAHDPELRARLEVTRASYPLASDPLSLFLGFFEESFRRFDFVLGMVEAERTLAALAQENANWAGVQHATELDRGQTGWRAFRCVRDVLETNDASACAGLDEVRILAEVARERVYDACQPAYVKGSRRREIAATHPDCRRALAEELPPGADESWRRRPEESEIAWIFRRAADRGLAFRDLSGDEGDAVHRAFREEMGTMVHALAGEQGAMAGVMGALAQSLVDGVHYRPERHTLQLNLGGTAGDVGWSFTGRRFGRIRGTLHLEARGVESLLSSGESWFAFAPLVGVEGELAAPSRGLVQIRMGARAGYLLSTVDDFLASPCTSGAGERPCSRPTAQLTLSATIVHLVRISLVGEWLPSYRGQAHEWALRPEIGLQAIWH